MGSACAPQLCLALMTPSSAPHYQLLPIRQVMGNAHYMSQPPLPKVSERVGLQPTGLTRGGAGLADGARGRSAAGRLFPRRLHAARRDFSNRLSEQGGRLRPVVPHGGRDAAHHRRRPQASRRAHRRHRRAPQLGRGNDPSPARPYDRTERRDFARRDALAALQARLPPAGAGAFPPIPAALSGSARRCPRGRAAGIFWRDRACVAATPSPRISRRSSARTGSSTPSHPSPGRKPISPATPIASRSRTVALLLSTSAA